jgi:lipid-A-disaccharide synthase
VLYLGGDLAHAMLVAKKLKYPAFAYVQEHIAWTGFYRLFFAPDHETSYKLSRQKKLKNKIITVGNLMVDSVADLPKWAPEKNTVVFLPGSRNWQIKHMTPIYEKIIRHMQAEMPHLSFQLVSSPFERAQHIGKTRLIRFEEAYRAELVITIPGTNTARLAALGIPMLSLFPLDKPEVIPLEGLPHLIGSLPIVGKKFKRYLADTLNNKTKYFVLPNIKADQEIVPEIRGLIEPNAAAELAIDLLKNPPKRVKMSQNLVAAMGAPGAAKKIVEEINGALPASA